MRTAAVLAGWLVACARGAIVPSVRPAPAPSTPTVVATARAKDAVPFTTTFEDPSLGIDATELHVDDAWLVALDAASGREVIAQHLREKPVGVWQPDPRVLVVRERTQTVVVDLWLALMPFDRGGPRPGAIQVFPESMRWVAYDQGDLVVSSNRRLARLEFVTGERWRGHALWTRSRLHGARGAGVRLPDDSYVVAGFDDRDGPIELAAFDSLAQEEWRATVAGPSCGSRDVSLRSEQTGVAVEVACATGETFTTHVRRTSR